MDIIEQLLCPQISMDVDDTPLDLEGNSSYSNDDDDKSSVFENDDFTEAEQIKTLLQMDEFDVSQIPVKLTAHELALKKTLFNIGPAVECMKLHCTSCNVHLGSAPINQFNRFIHPLLHVILCKRCYEFYMSGEFEKDEDGSELYCRWCGQGGKVMCCSDCAFVFCQKCVRTNLGKKILDIIRDSDDWKCFVCNPQQLINLKLICSSLYEFVKNKIKAVKQGASAEELKKDHSLCCNKSGSNKGIYKRKRNNSETDANFDINLEKRKMRTRPGAWKVNIPLIKATTTGAQFTATNAAQPINAQPIAGQSKQASVVQKNTPENVVFNSALANKPALVLLSKNKSISIKKPTQTNTTRNNICVNLSKKNDPAAQLRTNILRPPGPRTSHVYNFHPTSKVDKQQPWFEKATKLVGSITEKLCRQLTVLTFEQRNAGTVDKLALVHNKLQELLSSSVNSLIQVRKNLRVEFMDDLKKTRPNTTLKSSQNEIVLFKDGRQHTIPLRVLPPTSLVKIYKNNSNVKEASPLDKVIIDEDDDDDDDDVKLIEQEIETVEIIDDDDLEDTDKPHKIISTENIRKEVALDDMLVLENNDEITGNTESSKDVLIDVLFKNVENRENESKQKETIDEAKEYMVVSEETIDIKDKHNSVIEVKNENNESCALNIVSGAEESNKEALSALVKSIDLSEKEIKRALSVKVVLSSPINNILVSNTDSVNECELDFEISDKKGITANKSILSEDVRNENCNNIVLASDEVENIFHKNINFLEEKPVENDELFESSNESNENNLIAETINVDSSVKNNSKTSDEKDVQLINSVNGYYSTTFEINENVFEQMKSSDKHEHDSGSNEIQEVNDPGIESTQQVNSEEVEKEYCTAFEVHDNDPQRMKLNGKHEHVNELNEIQEANAPEIESIHKEVQGVFVNIDSLVDASSKECEENQSCDNEDPLAIDKENSARKILDDIYTDPVSTTDSGIEVDANT